MVTSAEGSPARVAYWMVEKVTPGKSNKRIVPVQIDSINPGAQLFASELQEPQLKDPLASLLSEYSRYTSINGVGLAAIGSDRFSIKVITDLSATDEQSQIDRKAMVDKYHSFAEALRKAREADQLPLTWSLSFFDTSSQPVSGIKEQIIREPGTSLISIVMFENPATPTT